MFELFFRRYSKHVVWGIVLAAVKLFSTLRIEGLNSMMNAFITIYSGLLDRNTIHQKWLQMPVEMLAVPCPCRAWKRIA